MERYYFDHNATTPVAPAVIDALLPALRDGFGNASSIHQPGQHAKQALERARRQTAALLGCSPKEIVFTSGGTESDNLAIFGVLGAARGHIVTTNIEHPAILAPCRNLDVTYLEADASGRVSPIALRDAMRPDTALVSVMHANNELGVIQDIETFARIAHEAGALFHSDGVQAAGKVPLNLKDSAVDLYSISGHKLNAPKGIGALYVRQGLEIHPRQFGGRHEQGRRAGTENVPGAVALGAACELARPDLTALRDRLEQGILARVPHAVVNGAGAPRVPSTTNIRFAGIEGEAMVIALDLRGFAVSSGAACSSGAIEPSHVLTAIGLTRDEAKSSIRFSLGLGNTVEQVDALIEAVAASAAHLRRLSPVYV